MNSFTIEYQKPEYRKLIMPKDLRAFLNKICSCIGIKNVSYSVSFIDEDTMHSMNKEYRNIDSSTDILSFAACDDVDGFNFVVGPQAKKNLGDILICPEVYFRNSKEFNVTEDEELHRLLIHGTLHLSGMDHKTNDSSEPMLKLQEEILGQIFC